MIFGRNCESSSIPVLREPLGSSSENTAPSPIHRNAVRDGERDRSSKRLHHRVAAVTGEQAVGAEARRHHGVVFLDDRISVIVLTANAMARGPREVPATLCA